MSGITILLITHFYPPEVGAPQRRLAAFVRRWCELGVRVRVLTSLPHYPQGQLMAGTRVRDSLGRSIGEFGEDIWRVPFVPTAGRGGTWKLIDHLAVSIFSLPLALSREPADVVLVTVPTLPALAVAYAASRRRGVPLIIEMRDAWPDLLFEQAMAPAPLTNALAMLISKAQRRADAVVSVSREFTGRLAERGVAPQRLHHIPNGVDPEAVPLLAPSNPRGALRVLYLGTHGVSQDLATAVRAIASVGHNMVDARFLGDGSEKTALIDMADSLGAPIRFGDPVRGAALWDAYDWAETCLVPLRDWLPFRYTIPSKLYEIMSCGRHVTACVSGEAAELVREARAGSVVPPGDVGALAQALEYAAVNREGLSVGLFPRRWVEDHAGYDQLASRYLDVISGVLA